MTIPDDAEIPPEKLARYLLVPRSTAPSSGSRANSSGPAVAPWRW